MGPNQSDSELSQNKPFSFVSQIFSGISLRQQKVTKAEGLSERWILLKRMFVVAVLGFVGVGWSYHPCLLGPWYLVSLEEVIWGVDHCCSCTIRFKLFPARTTSLPRPVVFLGLLTKGRSHRSPGFHPAPDCVGVGWALKRVSCATGRPGMPAITLFFTVSCCL